MTCGSPLRVKGQIRLQLWLSKGLWKGHSQPCEVTLSIWTRTCFKCRKTSATRDLCLSLSHSHSFPVSTNNLPWKWWHRRKGKDRTPQFLLISVLPYSSVSRMQSMGRRCRSHKKKKKKENTSSNFMQCFYFFWYKWYIPIQELQD